MNRYDFLKNKNPFNIYCSECGGIKKCDCFPIFTWVQQCAYGTPNDYLTAIKALNRRMAKRLGKTQAITDQLKAQNRELQNMLKEVTNGEGIQQGREEAQV